MVLGAVLARQSVPMCAGAKRSPNAVSGRSQSTPRLRCALERPIGWLMIPTIIILLALWFLSRPKAAPLGATLAASAVVPAEKARPGHQDSFTRRLSAAESVQSRLLSFVIALDQESESERKELILEHALACIPLDDLPGALESILPVSSPNGIELRDRLVRRWAEADPAAASIWAGNVSDVNFRGEALKQVAIAWANSDLSAATTWARSLPEDPAVAEASLALAYEAARTDPLGALETAGRLSPSPDRDAALAHAVSQWAATDPGAARAWASAIPTPDLRQQLLAAIATSAAAQNGSAAADFAATQLEPGIQQDRAAISIVEQWAQTSPTEAAAWVAQFPAGPLRAAAAQDLAAIWATQDPEAAHQWIARLPEGPVQQAAMQGAAQAGPVTPTQ